MHVQVVCKPLCRRPGPLLVTTVLMLPFTMTRAQETEPPVGAEQSARLKDARSPGPMPYTAADHDPDVAKRPHFLWVLARSRVSSFLLRDFSAWSSTPPDQIPPEAMEALRSRWTKVLARPYRPVAPQAIEWRWQNDYPTAPEQNVLVARWRTPAGLLGFGGRQASRGIGLCLRLSGDARITFRFRTDAERPGHWMREEDVNPQDILDKPRLLEMLTTYFRFPFEDVDEFQVNDGPSGVYDGVRVFVGDIRWPRKPVGDDPNTAFLGYESLSDPDNHARLFITDSEPQYFCIAVDTEGPP